MAHKFIFITLMLLSVQSFAQSACTLQDAIEKKWIAYSLVGNWDNYDKQEFQDAEGKYFGKCMTLKILNKLDSTYFISVENGLMLLSNDTLTQNMLVTKSIQLELNPKQNKTIQLYAMCSDIHDGIPNKQTNYVIGKPADNKLRNLTQIIDEMYMQNMVGQGAVWAITNDATEDDLRNFGASSASIALSIQLLNKAGLMTVLNPKPEEVTKASSLDAPSKINQSVFILNASLVYSAVLIIILLLGSTIFLFIKSKKQ